MEPRGENYIRVVRFFLVLLATLLASLGLCSGPTDIVVWGPSLGADSKGLEAAIRAFEAKHPEYRLKLLSLGAGGMNPQKLMTAIVGGVPPDVIDQDRLAINDWAARGAFRSLDDLIQRDKSRDPETPTPDKYFPAPWHEVTYQGHVFGIPTGADNRALYWNKSLFRERAGELKAAGLDPNRPPRTWSELLAYTRVLTLRDGNGVITRPGFIPNFGNSWLYTYAFQNDAPFLSQDGTKCLLASPPVEEALRFMLKTYGEIGGYARGTEIAAGYGKDSADPFANGRLPMKIDGDWAINNIMQYAPGLNYGVAPARSQTTVTTGGDGLLRSKTGSSHGSADGALPSPAGPGTWKARGPG